MKRLPDWIIYIIVAVCMTLIVVPLWEYLDDLFSPKKNYQRGLQAGQEYAEYYCHSFDQDYIGSLDYIKKNDPELYKDVMSKEE